LGRFRKAFSESDLPSTVDIIEWAAASESMRRRVEREAVDLHPVTNSSVRSSLRYIPDATLADLAEWPIRTPR